MNALRRALLRLAALVLAGALAACGGGDPPAQVPVARVAMTGTATGGSTTGPGEVAAAFEAKGSAGILRTANAMTGSLAFEVSLDELTGPYALHAILIDPAGDQADVYSVAPSRGVANLTPLTSLVIAQLYGQDPATVYGSFGAGGSVDASRITTDSLAAAQVQVVAYLHDELGVDVPATTGDFVTAPFSARAGDPIYDSVVAIGAALQASGSDFARLASAVALASHLCQVERVRITIAGVAGDFCPQSKSATEHVDDTTIVDDVFVDRHQNTLTVVAHGAAVDSVRYATAAGPSWACSSAACVGATLGPPAADGTRSITFAALALQGATGPATVDGTLLTAQPGIALPVLPCDSNRFIAIFSDLTVVGVCADPDPFGFGVGGVPGSLIGVDVSRGAYDFGAPSGSDPTNAKISLITDGYGAVLGVQFTDDEPDTFLPRRRFVCLFEACTGIALGPVTIDTDFGGPDFPFYIRPITFDGTPLAGVDDAGLPTGATLTLQAELTPAYLLPIPALTWPPLADCAAGLTALVASADASAFNACVPAGHTSTDAATGDVTLTAISVEAADDQLTVVLKNGVVDDATLTLSLVPGPFMCHGGCPGITVSAPDAKGRRTASFAGAVLHEQFFGADGPRTVSIASGSVSFAKK